MSGDPRLSDSPPPNWWERWWPRVLVVVQTTLGAAGFLHELLAETPNATILGFSVFLLGAIPATLFVGRVFGGK